jgi:glucans biosynthesis protein
MLKRREVLRLAGGVAALTALSARPGRAQQGQSPDEVLPFSATFVADLARNLAAKPFSAPSSDLPSALNGLNVDAYAGIKAKEERFLWAQDPSGFAIEPLHRGFVFTTPMQIHMVEDGLSRRLAYDSGSFDFGAIKLGSAPAGLDFSGFRIHQRDDNGKLHEIAMFQGATFFRALAPGQSYGVTARGLSVQAGDSRGEEFPIFRAVWIEKPTRANNVVVIHALLDSDSLTGAYRFTVHPGDAVIIDTECSLFPRVNIDNFGLGTMSATCLFNDIDRRGADDLRDAAAEVSGLQILTGADEWVWRPVANRNALQISEFIDRNPHGFGFIQRGRDFTDYHDEAQHWERRPSVWIEPIGDWGAGSVELLEIPSDAESAQNIIAFWRGKPGLVKGQQADFAYRQFWCWTPPSRPPLSAAVASRGGRGANGRQRRFLVDFRGEALADPVRVANLKANLIASSGKVVAVEFFPTPAVKSCQVQFDIEIAGDKPCELRLTLEAQGAPISETWLYRWTP